MEGEYEMEWYRWRERIPRSTNGIPAGGLVGALLVAGRLGSGLVGIIRFNP